MAMTSTEPPGAGSASAAEEVNALTQIYCGGAILAAVQRARIWPDSKDSWTRPRGRAPRRCSRRGRRRPRATTTRPARSWLSGSPPALPIPRRCLVRVSPTGTRAVHPSRASASPSGSKSPAATTTSSPSFATSASRCTTFGHTSRARPPRTRRTRTRPPSSPPRTSPSFPASVSARRTTGIPTGPSSASSPAACSKPPRASCETCSPSSNDTASCRTARDDTISTDRNRPC